MSTNNVADDKLHCEPTVLNTLQPMYNVENS